jgi:hypothetical protein
LHNANAKRRESCLVARAVMGLSLSFMTVEFYTYRAQPESMFIGYVLLQKRHSQMMTLVSIMA